MAAAPAGAAAPPDATLDFAAGSAEPGAGYSWARGTLHYRGKSYPFRVSGLGVTYLDAPVRAGGTVYHLARLRDFNGSYSEVEVDAALARTGATGAIKNRRGVLIGLRSATEGLGFDISLIGVSIRLERRSVRSK